MARDITRRLAAKYEPQHQEQLSKLVQFAFRLTANKQMAKAISEVFPSVHTSDDGTTTASNRDERPRMDLHMSPYDQRIKLTIEGLSLSQVCQVRELLKQSPAQAQTA